MPSMPPDLPLVHRGALRRAREFGRQLVQHSGHAAHLAHLPDLRLEVGEIEALARLDLLRELLRFATTSTFFCASSISESTSPMPRMRDAMRSGWKTSRPSDLLRDAGELDRRAGDVPDRQRRAAARIAIELGQHDAGERQRVAERARGVDRVLALHRVDDEQRLDRLDRRMQRGDLLHHRVVDREAARGVDDQHVVVVLARPVERRLDDRDRRLVGRRREEIDADLRRERGAAARWRPDDRRRPTRAAPSSCSPRGSGARAWRPSWSCRLPAARRAGSPPAAAWRTKAVRRHRPSARPTRDAPRRSGPGRASANAATSAPSAFALTDAMNSRTTGSATSASSSASRTSRSASSMLASVRRAWPRSSRTTRENRWVRLSSIGIRERCA